MLSKTLLAVRCMVCVCCQVPLCSCSTFQCLHGWLSSCGISLGSLASIPAEGTGKGLQYLSASPSVREPGVLSWAAAAGSVLQVPTSCADGGQQPWLWQSLGSKGMMQL